MGKTILITGASSGIGEQTAIALAKQGHKLIIQGKNPERTKKVYEKIRKLGKDNVEYYLVDLSLMANVNEFANTIREKYDHIDVLINNAGCQTGNKRVETREGHEVMFATNTLAPFLLTNQLLPLLKKSESARIVTVGSEAYTFGEVPNLDDVESKKNYEMFKTYGITKLYTLWNMKKLARELEEKGIKNITVNTCEPGLFVATRLGRESYKVLKTTLSSIMYLHKIRSAKIGAKTSIFLASADEVEGKTGGYYGKCKTKKVGDKWLSKEGEEQIWNYCKEQCKGYIEELLCTPEGEKNFRKRIKEVPHQEMIQISANSLKENELDER